MTDKIAAIILAAGFSSRFGGAKLLAKLDNGATVFEQTCRRISTTVDQVIVVTRPEIAPHLAELGQDLKIFQHPERGMGASLAFGASFIEGCSGALVCLADMPLIQSSTYSAIARQLRRDTIVIPSYHSQAGNPVAFGADYFPELLALDGDIGGRPIVKNHPDAVNHYAVEDAAILSDIDTPEDLARIQME